jgi:hypothetical protein
MPTTPDRPARDTARPAGPQDAITAAEAAHLAARDTVPVDVRRRPTSDVSNHETVRVQVRGRPDDPGNRETVALPQQRGRRRSGRAPLLVAAGFATVWAALLSYLPVAVVMGLARALEGAGGLPGAARTGLTGWLLGHGVPLGTSIGPVGLTPLLLTVLVAWRLNRAGLHVTRAIGARHSGSLRDATTVAVAVGVTYGLLGALAAWAVSGPGLAVPVIRSGGTFTAVGVAGALVGALRGTGALVVVARRLPPVLRHAVRTGVLAALLVLAAGAGFTGLSVAIGGGEAADMISAYRTGVAGQAGITLVSLAYGVNAAVWAAAYLLGPGFLLGTDTTVRLTEVTVGPLPTVPLLAGLPVGPVGATGAALLAVPVFAGMASGWLLTRRLMRSRPPVVPAARQAGGVAATDRPASGPVPSTPGWGTVLGAAVLAGPAAGVVLGLLAWFSGGPLGSGRLAQIGPVPWQVAATGAAVVAVSAALGAAAARAFRPPRRS